VAILVGIDAHNAQENVKKNNKKTTKTTATTTTINQQWKQNVVVHRWYPIFAIFVRRYLGLTSVVS
jgi:hypothetical protein